MLRFIANTNLFIAFAALVLALGSGLSLGTIGSILPFLLLLFFATVADYNWHRLMKVKLKIGSTDKNEWGNQHSSIIIVFAVMSTIALLISIIYAPIEITEWLFLMAIVTFLYSFPFYKMGWQKLDIRQIPGLKNALIAFTWTIATLYLPYLLSDKTESSASLALLITQRSVFFFAITIPFDIKDVDEDRAAGWKTIPVLFNKTIAQRMTNYLIVAMMLISIVHLLIYRGNHEGFAAIITAVYTLIIVNQKSLKQHPLYYPIYMDGAILLFGLFLIAFSL
ncbi:MAG: UbiA family prenyltransferase [Prolixibacteraceae bacterium]